MEAHNVIGFYAPAAWMPPAMLPLVSPNSMWTAVFVHNVWRLVDIQAAVQQQSVRSGLLGSSLWCRPGSVSAGFGNMGPA